MFPPLRGKEGTPVAPIRFFCALVFFFIEGKNRTCTVLSLSVFMLYDLN